MGVEAPVVSDVSRDDLLVTIVTSQISILPVNSHKDDVPTIGSRSGAD
jgi:hypothetical protein